MVMICRLVGLAFILLGLFGAIQWERAGDQFFIPIFCGVLLLAVAEMLQSLRRIEARLVDFHLQNAGTNLQTYLVHSHEFVVFRGEVERYQFFEMDNEQYIRVRVFKNYTDYSGETYTISLPNRQQVSLALSERYSPGVDLWNRNGLTYIKLGALGLRGTLSADGKMIVESLDNLS